VLSMIVEEQGLGAPFALVVAGAPTELVDVAKVALGLRMNRRVAIPFAGRGLRDLRPQPLGQPQHVDRAMHGWSWSSELDGTGNRSGPPGTPD
jgi:hypothetical protein